MNPSMAGLPPAAEPFYATIATDHGRAISSIGFSSGR